MFTTGHLKDVAIPLLQPSADACDWPSRSRLRNDAWNGKSQSGNMGIYTETSCTNAPEYFDSRNQLTSTEEAEQPVAMPSGPFRYHSFVDSDDSAGGASGGVVGKTGTAAARFTWLHWSSKTHRDQLLRLERKDRQLFDIANDDSAPTSDLGPSDSEEWCDCRSHYSTTDSSDTGRWMASGSTLASIFNLSNATLGAGIVAIPFALSSLGLVLGCTVILFFGFCSIVTTKALVNLMNFSGARAYEELAVLCGGKGADAAVRITILLFNLGTSVGYLCCIGATFEILVKAYSLDAWIPSSMQWAKNPHAFLIVITTVAVVPLCLVEKLSQLAFASLLGFLALEIIVVASVVTLAQKGFAPSFNLREALLPRSYSAVLEGISLTVFAFACHSNATSVYVELVNASYRRMVIVSTRSVALAAMTYLTIGISGFLVFGPATKSNILLNFESEVRSSYHLTAAFIGILLGVTLSFPMNILPCRASIISLIKDPNATNPGLFRTYDVLTSIFLVLLSLVVAMKVPSLAALFGLTGATCGSAIAFIFPAAFIITYLPGPLRQPRKLKALLMLVLGFLIAILGTWQSICFQMAARRSTLE